MKNRLLLTALLLCSSLAWAQERSLSGRVADAATQQSLPGASIVLTRLPDSLTVARVSDGQGNFSFTALVPGRYRLRISYVGYVPLMQGVRLREQDVDLGLLQLQEDAEQLMSVEIIRQQALAIQRGDTTQYAAGAFKTNPDASAEDLIKKMPGVVVQGGRVQAQGEEVRRVLVDGREFFGEDASAALRNLPAEVIDKIQVFDQQSEQAQRSGFDDGQTTKTINIVTKPEMRNGQFGRVYAGAGTDGRYALGGNLNLFGDKRRVSILGQSNNINQQNFAGEDLSGVAGSGGRGGRGGRGGGGRGGAGGGNWGGGGGRGGNTSDFTVGQQNGLITTHAAGLNYTDLWGKKMEVTGSYFFNQTTNLANQRTRLEYMGERTAGQTYEEISRAESTTTNHRVNMRLNYTIDANNSILMRPRLSLQRYKGVSDLSGSTRLGEEVLGSTANRFVSQFDAISFGNDLLYRHTFSSKRGRNLTANLSTSYDEQSGESSLRAANRFTSGGNMETDSLLQQSTLSRPGWRLGGDLRFTEPLGERSRLMLNYRNSYQRSEPNKRTSQRETSESPWELNPNLSSQLLNTYLSHSAGASYMLRTEKGMLNTGLNYQTARLYNDLVFPREGIVDRRFNNLLPSAMYRYNISKDKNLRLNYRTATNAPSAEQLLEAIDNSNPLQISLGNARLQQDYQHSLFLRYSASNLDKASTFFALLSGSLSARYIGNSVLLPAADTVLTGGYLVPAGVQLSQPVNLNGYRNLRSFASWGRPVPILKSNLNTNATLSYSQIPGLINGQQSLTSNYSAGAGLVLSSNISEKIDFTLGTQSSYTVAENNLRESLNNRFLNQSSQASIKWILPGNFTLQGDGVHQYYGSFAGSEAQHFILLNAGLGKRLFKNKGEISLYAYDLLNQNTNIQRNVTQAYVEHVQTNALNRYVMLRFSYNIRNFTKTEPRTEPRRGAPAEEIPNGRQGQRQTSGDGSRQER
jgi:uncharacterized membrane protein YgcG